MDLWLPGVQRLPTPHTSGSMAGGGGRKLIWHRTVGNDFAGNAAYLASRSYEPHLLWDPRTGQLGQFFPANVYSKALTNAPGGVETNRAGDLCIQIEVVDHGDLSVITDWPLLGLDRIISWARSLGIPDALPGGAFPPIGHTNPYPTGPWTGARGHFAHAQVPENIDAHTDPGLMDPAKLFGGPVVQPFPATGDPIAMARETLNFGGTSAVPLTADEVDLLQFLLAKAGGWIAPVETSARAWQDRYTNVRNVVGWFQTATRTGGAGGDPAKPDYIVGPGTWAALARDRKL